MMRGNSFGIVGMQERARAFGGEVRGGPLGTRVVIEEPLSSLETA